MDEGNANGTIYLDTKYPPSYWGITATLSKVANVEIKAGTAKSTALDFNSDNLKGFSPTAIFTPSTWSSAKIGLEVSLDGTTWFGLHQWFSGAFDTQNNATALSCHTIDGFPLRGMPFVRVVSGTIANPVNQTNTCIIPILCGTI